MNYLLLDVMHVVLYITKIRYLCHLSSLRHNYILTWLPYAISLLYKINRIFYFRMTRVLLGFEEPLYRLT